MNDVYWSTITANTQILIIFVYVRADDRSSLNIRAGVIGCQELKITSVKICSQLSPSVRASQHNT